MPNKIDITQTNVQLSSSISVWSGSNLTGPAQSVPIYDASGTASIAQSVSDEYYLVRRNGIIQWAPILASVGSGLSFAFSEFSEESFNESYGSVVFRGSPIRMTNSSDNDTTAYNPIRKVYRVVSTDETDIDPTFYQTARKSLRSVSTDETDVDTTTYNPIRKRLRSVSTDETDVDTTFYQTTRRYIIIYDFNVSFESIIKLNVDKTINVLDGSFV
jgi:hypothetical protein